VACWTGTISSYRWSGSVREEVFISNRAAESGIRRRMTW
jgi:hypothetical protein